MLAIEGLGLALPPTYEVADLVAQARGELAGYAGWPRCHLAGEGEHPAEMASRALVLALAEAHTDVGALSLILSVSVSRDYPPSWSVATEVARLAGAPPHVFGFDLTIGCLGILVGLETAAGWLRGRKGARAAIVCGEKWGYTIARNDPKSAGLWAHGDGASAIVAAEGVAEGEGGLSYDGASFTSRPELNGHVLIRYGGTRFPVAPPGDDPFLRQLSSRPKPEVFASYAGGYREVILAERARAGAPDRVVCNQVSPKLVDEIGRSAGATEPHLFVSGRDHGHLGATDLVLGLRALREEGARGTILLAASTPYAFGAATVRAR